MKISLYLCNRKGEKFTKVEKLADAKAHSEVAVGIGKISIKQ